MESGKNLNPIRPKFFGDGFIRRNHALFDHLMRFVVLAKHDSRHLAIPIKQHLAFRDRQIERSCIKAKRPQLPRERINRPDRAVHLDRLASAPKSSHTAAIYDTHHLFIGETRLGTNDRFGEFALDHRACTIESHENRKCEPIFVRHKRADAIGKFLRQHRHDPIAEIHARRTAIRFAIQLRTWAHKMRNVGNMHPKHAIASAVGL